MRRDTVRTTLTALASWLILAGGNPLAFAYPNGPLWYVTDIGPYCAGCHASTSIEQFPEHPKAFAEQWSIDKKHIADIRKAQAYQDLSPKQQDELIAAVRQVDAHASITLEAPASVKAGEELTVTAMTKGGAGPVVGIALVDNDIRFQARPIASTGFLITSPPKIFGPDGKQQHKWNNMRYSKLDGNINFAIVFGIKADLHKKHFDSTKVQWTLRAPIDPGIYTMAAVFFYGTEKASPIGTVEQLGRKMPKGGFLAHSGRVMFSQVQTITVR